MLLCSDGRCCYYVGVAVDGHLLFYGCGDSAATVLLLLLIWYVNCRKWYMELDAIKEA
ncbi:hypothetical protein BVRB_6g144570 [Beta vulgaris subsp. vulgaris]|nr:hypothetical protein BVRB_6g144570 [Beta vulgaris subsp. vulgaris]